MQLVAGVTGISGHTFYETRTAYVYGTLNVPHLSGRPVLHLHLAAVVITVKTYI